LYVPARARLPAARRSRAARGGRVPVVRSWPWSRLRSRNLM
jgi:hypothetical protein